MKVLSEIYEGEGLVTPYGRDQGIDGVIKISSPFLKNNRLILIQAKKYSKNPIGLSAAKEFKSSVDAYKGTVSKIGLLLTSSKFTKGAIDFIDNHAQYILLIKVEELIEIMVERKIGYKKSNIINEYFEF